MFISVSMPLNFYFTKIQTCCSFTIPFLKSFYSKVHYNKELFRWILFYYNSFSILILKMQFYTLLCERIDYRRRLMIAVVSLHISWVAVYLPRTVKLINFTFWPKNQKLLLSSKKQVLHFDLQLPVWSIEPSIIRLVAMSDSERRTELLTMI